MCVKENPDKKKKTKSEHQYSLKKSIRIRRICSRFILFYLFSICLSLTRFQDYHSHSRKLIEQFVNRGYKKDVFLQQIRKVDQLDRKQLLHQQKRHDKPCITAIYLKFTISLFFAF